MLLEEAIEKILTGNCTLFTGAGFSYGSTNVNGGTPKAAGELCNHLYDLCNIDEKDGDLKTAADVYAETHGEFQLIELLRKEYTITAVSEEHKLIGSLPSRFGNA